MAPIGIVDTPSIIYSPRGEGLVGEEITAPGGGGGGPAIGDGMLLEAGTDFLLLETGDYLLLE